MINKIIWGKYYTDSCSATIIIVNNVAAPKNCTITRRWRYFWTVRSSILVRHSVFFVSDDCLQSVRHQTDEILYSAQRNRSPRFPKTTFECCQCLRLWAGMNSCNRLQSETDLANLEANLPVECIVQCRISTNWLWPLMCVHEHVLKQFCWSIAADFDFAKDSAGFVFQCLEHLTDPTLNAT